MRIQHNIAAMNAYRNYNTNTSAVSKNLEKLSSGYKINRAGDDAAGLAISEKMRAQISGLNAASKNVKDGISLVKTAEGAMQEVQDMLNRMVTLATQSANGTYDNEVDRLNLQKEVDQLRSEINRIADSANFNGIKLLDGTQEIKTSYQLSSPTEGADSDRVSADGVFQVVSDGQLGVDPQAGVFTYDLSQLKITITDPEAGAEGAAAAAAGGAEAQPAVKAKYEFDLAGKDGTALNTKEIDGQAIAWDTDIDTTMAAFAGDYNTDDTKEYVASWDDANGKLVLEAKTAGAIGESGPAAEPATDITGVTANEVVAGAEAVEGDQEPEPTPAVAAEYEIDLTNKVEGDFTGKKIDGVDVTWNQDLDTTMADFVTTYNNTADKEYTAKWENNKLTLTAKTPGAVGGDGPAAAPTTDIAGVDVKEKTQGVDGTTPNEEETTGSYTLSLGAHQITLNLKPGEYSGADLAKEIATALNAAAKNAAKNDEAPADPDAPAPAAADAPGEAPDEWDGTLAGAAFTASFNGSTLTITMDEAPTQPWAEDMTIKFDKGNGNGGEQFKPTVLVEPVDNTTNRQYAQATLDLSKMNIKDGTSIQIGNSTYTFAVGSDSRFKGVSNVVDLTDLTQKQLTKPAAGDATEAAWNSAIITAANRLSKAASANSSFLVGSDTNGVISLTEKEGAIDYAVNNLAGADGKGTAGEGSSIKDDPAHDAADAGGANAENADATVSDWKGLVKWGQASVSGNGLTLQIGDTSDSYNQLTVSIGDIHTKALGINDIDIGTQTGAQAAVNTIKTAINSVSSIRGTLGATQNRLEHTANNLSVMAENIQDAESTIRDTDVAEEMMSYTKNNILVQSAQAMLAQANQIPQGVLQLLG